MFNLVTALAAWLALKRVQSRSIHLAYFLWLMMAFNIFYAGSYIAGWFVGPSLDSALFMQDLNQNLLKEVFIALGLAIVVLGIHATATNLRFIFSATDRLNRLSKLVALSYLGAIVVKVLSALMNRSDNKGLVILGAFGSTGLFLIWLHLIRFWPAIKRSGESLPRIGANRNWIIAALVVSLLFVVVLGRGVGQIQ